MSSNSRKPMRKSIGGAIDLGNGLSQFKGNMRPVRLPTTGMKYSSARLNPGSELNRIIKLKTNFKKPKFSSGGMMNRPIMMPSQSPVQPRMADPRQPIPQLLNNVNQRVASPIAQLAAMRQRMPARPMPGRMQSYADGGKFGMSSAALRAISEALEHLGNSDTASASRTLRSSKEAMQNPDVVSAADSLRSSARAKLASDKLTGIMNNSSSEKLAYEDGGMVACPHCGKHY